MKHIIIIFIAALTLLQSCSSILRAEPTSVSQAEDVVTGWLKADAQPLGAALGWEVSNIQTFTDDTNTPIYYIVYLQPSGFVIVPADDLIEPIIGFVNGQNYDPSLNNPLGALVTCDLNGRIAAVRNDQKLKGTNAMEMSVENKAKWEQLIGFAGEDIILPMAAGLPTVSDPRIDPLVQSEWGQTTCCSSPLMACYNYYTPPNSPNNPFSFPCGCVATAMAQVMRYHQHPNFGIGINTFRIWVNGVGYMDVNTIGGNGIGGPYQWASMTLDPNCSTLALNRQAIGALCYDAGVSVSMNYSPPPWGSSALLSDADANLVSLFGYSNSIYFSTPSSNIGTALTTMINPNLDYNNPVILGIGPGATGDGHAVVCDGYGYNFSTPYHHLNMGWDGNSNAWYNFIADMPNNFNYVEACIYNIFVSGQNEIISGRVVDSLGAPINGATVTAAGPGGPYVATTNSRGIYALGHVLSASTYTVSATKAGHAFTPNVANTGTSVDSGLPPGNVWAVNFVSSSSLPPTIVYVDASRPPGGNGTSWANAYKYLQDALADPNAGAIWVADGTYKPDQGAGQTPGNRNATFVLKSGVSLYGGYAGFGATPNPNVRHITRYKTILSGDLKGNDIPTADPCNFLSDPCRTDNSYNIITGSNANAATVLDGFTITGGNANTIGTWPTSNGGGMVSVNADCTVNKCTFLDNAAERGGAMFNQQCDMKISNCTFYRNVSKYDGGGMDNYICSPTLLNCRFISNKACGAPGNSGGGVYNHISSSPAITNCSFTNNTATYGGAISNIHTSSPSITNCTFNYNQAWIASGAINDFNNSNPTITNCILWGNYAPNSPHIGDSGGSAATVNYSDVHDGWSGAGGIGNIDADPCFIDYDGFDNTLGTLDDNNRLLRNSPCIDVGDNTAVPSGVRSDIDIRLRIADGDCDDREVVDMGASEFAYLYLGDLNCDCRVNLIDFAILGQNWLISGR